jgi:hypothetical protein
VEGDVSQRSARPRRVDIETFRTVDAITSDSPSRAIRSDVSANTLITALCDARELCRGAVVP